MKNKKIGILFFFSLTIVFLSGCTDIFNDQDNTTLYKSQGVKISYTIVYGYNISCSGNGDYGIKYDCNEPEVLKGNTVIMEILNGNYTNKTDVATFNNMKSWNINRKEECKSYTLGIKADITSESFMINDLNGEDALTIEEIENKYPEIVAQYCQPQKNKKTVFIDLDDPEIKNKAFEIYNSTESKNSFVVAKELFIWLKENTFYEKHSASNNVQPAYVTFKNKTGDCDDLTFLYISLCKSLNIPSRFIRGFLIDENSAVSHAWAEIFVGNIGDKGWIPVECAGGNKNSIQKEIHQNFGIEDINHLRLYKDNGTSESLNISLSGIFYSYDQNIDFEKPLFFANVSDYTIIEKSSLFIDENNNRMYK